jgi:hypothetical protein
MDTIFRRIMHHANLDVRRTLGVFDRIHIPEGFHGPTIPETSLRWFPSRNMFIYTDFRPNSYEFTVYKNVNFYDPFTILSCEVHKTWGDDGQYAYMFDYYDVPIPFASGDIITVIDPNESDESIHF